jgi:signal recognition particle subunit SRP54
MKNASIDEKIITTNEAIILSMTKKEREEPKVINGSRKKRIAVGAGTDISTINKLLKQFKMTTEMMKKMSKGDRNPIPSGTIPDELLNQLKPK